MLSLAHISRIIGFGNGQRLVVWCSVSIFCEQSYSLLSPVSTGVGDCVQAGIGLPPRYATNPSGSTQPCIPLGSLSRVLAFIGWGKGEIQNVSSAGWQVTVCANMAHTFQ